MENTKVRQLQIDVCCKPVYIDLGCLARPDLLDQISIKVDAGATATAGLCHVFLKEGQKYNKLVADGVTLKEAKGVTVKELVVRKGTRLAPANRWNVASLTVDSMPEGCSLPDLACF